MTDEAELMRRLADELQAKGYLTDERWHEVFARVPRHLFVPYGAIESGPPGDPHYTLVRGDRPEDRAAWLDALYTDQTILTHFDTGPAEQALSVAASPPRDYRSSSTAPGFLAYMLDALDVTTGDRVLDVGTGTGYGTALLCERLGDAHVTSIDLDERLVDLARTRLADAGYRPLVVAADGANGYPQRGPYDRLLATTSWPYVPPRWLAQLAPDATVVGNLLGRLGGALYRLTVDADGCARGEFLAEWVGFMQARPYTTMRDFHSVDTGDGEYETRSTTVDPMVLEDRAFGFVAQVHTRDVHPYRSTDEQGRPLAGYLAPDGSWAEVYVPDPCGARQVDQGGPRRLWDEIEAAYRFWTGHDRPAWTRFGLTVAPDEQYAWFLSPDIGHRWPLWPA